MSEQLTFHPIAKIFPLIEGAGLESLAADIRQNGLREPAYLYEGKVLDGRNRATACLMAGVKLRTQEFTGTRLEALAFVWSENFHRRQLSESQAAAAEIEREALSAEYAAEVAKMEGEAKGRKAQAKGKPRGEKASLRQQIAEEKSDDRRTATVRARAAGTNRTYLAAAKKIKQSDPESFEAIKQGTKTITEVQREHKEKDRQQRRNENQEKVANAADPIAVGARFATIVIDPPWDWGDEGDVDQLGRARPTYATMSLERLMDLPVEQLADKDCHLYLWITNRSLPKGFALLERWGFRYVTCLTWCKPSIGMGNYFRGSTEQVLFGVKGSQALLRKNVGTWFAAPRGPEHSSKPAEFFALIETCSPAPRLEMFARGPRKGWTLWGADAPA